MERLAPMIARALKDSERWKRVAFMAFCCEPMVSNYVIYRAGATRGNVGVLKDAVNLAWGSALSEESPADAAAYISRCTRQSPGPFNHSTPYALGAADACMAITHLLRCLDGPALADAIEASDNALWTVESLFPNDLELSDLQRAEQLRLVKAEARRQADCLKCLAAATSQPDELLIATLRREAEASPPSLTLLKPHAASHA